MSSDQMADSVPCPEELFMKTECMTIKKLQINGFCAIPVILDYVTDRLHDDNYCAASSSVRGSSCGSYTFGTKGYTQQLPWKHTPVLPHSWRGEGLADAISE